MAELSESRYHRYSRFGAAGGLGGGYAGAGLAGAGLGGAGLGGAGLAAPAAPRNSFGYAGGYNSAECGNFAGFGAGGGRFGELARGSPIQSGVVFDDNKIVSEQHYHHGDHHHHHHQRHLHHFHDLHLIQEATETMDLRNTPQVCTRVIPSETGPMNMNLRPDLIGQMVFNNGAGQYGFGVQYRLNEPGAAPAPSLGAGGLAGASAYRAGSYAGYGGAAAGYGGAAAGYSAAAGYGYGGLGRGIVEEELIHHRRSSI